MIWLPNVWFAACTSAREIACKEVSLPIVSANILKTFPAGVAGRPAKSRWQLSVRVGSLELTQQAVAVLDGGIKRLLRGFLAGKSVLQLLVNHATDQGERSEPN